LADLQLLSGGGSVEKPQRLTPGLLLEVIRQSLGAKLRFNELTLRPELDGSPIPDSDLQHFYIKASLAGYKVDKVTGRDALLCAARRNSYHPIRDYLNHIADDSGVSEADIDSLATTYLGTTDSLYDQMLAATLIGAVNRVMVPGCKFDTCTVLHGAQGICKSTFWKVLASPAWFCDTPNEEKDLKLAIHCCWIYEIAELETKTGNKEAGAIKALLSSSVDMFRVPYGTGVEEHPRPSILVGSCNRDDFLRDPTGARRFWVITLPHDPNKSERIDIKKLEAARDSIWKSAVMAYRSGRTPVLSPDGQVDSNNRNVGFEPENIWLEPLRRWSIAAPLSFSTADALVGSGLRQKDHLNSHDQRIAAEALRSLGFVQDKNQTRHEGRRVRAWRHTSVRSVADGLSKTGQNRSSAMEVRDLTQISDKNHNNNNNNNNNNTSRYVGGVCVREKGRDMSESSESMGSDPLQGSGWDVTDHLNQ
jgi:predicted P-loop ATPase